MKNWIKWISVFVILVVSFWLLADKNRSYYSPRDVADYRVSDVLKVEAYTGQEEGLVFLFTTKRDVGAMFTKLGQYGWKYDTMIWAGLGSPDLTRLQPVVFEDRLIYGLLEKADDKTILANGVRAEMIKLNFFPIVQIDEYGLQDLSVWYVKDPPAGSVLVELVDSNTGEVIEESELDVRND